jgi:tripartite-type tricarboxylate transporter receptor subunit TctC
MGKIQLAGASIMRVSAAGLKFGFALISFLFLTLLAFAPRSARAAFPDRPVKMIVPFAPGGGVDIVARVLADFMSKDLGQPVIVENKPGAGTIVGTAAAAGSTPDGYTLMMASTPFAINPSINANLPYDTFKAFAPVALVARSFDIVVVNPKLPIKSVQDVIAYAEANPGKLNYGSPGIGTSPHLAGELFKSLAHVDMTHVPYKGSAPAITDLLGGQIQIMFSTVPSAASYVRSGQLRALAVTSAQRSAAYADLPTVAEAGVTDYVVEGWYGLCAPAGTAPDVLSLLNASVTKAIRSGIFKTIETNEGLTFTPGTPEDLGRYWLGEAARWRNVIKDAHIQVQ